MFCLVAVLVLVWPGLSDRSSFDCKMRQLAMDYAHKIQPWLSATKSQELADALNGAVEAQGCNVSAKTTSQRSPKPPSFPDTVAASAVFYVDTNKGSDTNTGSMDAPFQTIPKAVSAARSLSGKPSTIVLRAGTFYLEDTIALTEQDSNLTIHNYPGEEVTISGGKVIKPSWKVFDTKSPMNIYQADLSSLGVDSVMGLRVNGMRAIRARYPNANPETDGFDSTLQAKKWLPPVSESPKVEENPLKPLRNSSESFQMYQLGIGGVCANFDPPAGYWCGSKTSGGGAFTYRVPSGMVADKSILPHQPYKNATGAVVQAWRPGHWASWMFEVGDYDSSTGTFSFSKGGFQGARGNDNGDEFFIENVMEELDGENEWFFDASTKTLYFFYNASSGTMPPDNTTFVVPMLKMLLSVKGSSDHPVWGVSIWGITFRDTAYTYMDPHGMPSGGDWGLQRTAALFFERTESTLIQECVFERLDGNGIMISGYNRNTTVIKNEFLWIGDTAIASWGNTSGSSVEGMGWDGTDGNQPRFNQILYNYVHELGIFEKQSSFYFQAKSCQNNITGNIFFNGPRAGINFNDGFGGGSTVAENLLLNTCRESGDHGPFNSWDRQVYMTKVGTGSPSVEKAYDDITQNFIIANYDSGFAIDNDDGSAYYKTHNNFFAYAKTGMKNDFGGHNNHHYQNIYAYSSSGYGICAQLKGHEDYFYDNTLVLEKDGDYGRGACSGDGKTVVHDNRVYSPTGKITECGKSLEAWQALGNDPGTLASPLPADEELVSMIRELLSLPPPPAPAP